MTSHVLDISIWAVAAFKARQVFTVFVGLLGEVTAVLFTGFATRRVHRASLAHDGCGVKIAAIKVGFLSRQILIFTQDSVFTCLHFVLNVSVNDALQQGELLLQCSCNKLTTQ